MVQARGCEAVEQDAQPRVEVAGQLGGIAGEWLERRRGRQPAQERSLVGTDVAPAVLDAVAGAEDHHRVGLNRLADRARDSPRGIEIGAEALECGCLPLTARKGGVVDRRPEHGDAEIMGDVCDHGPKPTLAQPRDPRSGVLGQGRPVNHPDSREPLVVGVEPGEAVVGQRVALDELVERVEYRLGVIVACGEAVRLDAGADALLGRRQDQVERHPRFALGDQVISADPRQRV